MADAAVGPLTEVKASTRSVWRPQCLEEYVRKLAAKKELQESKGGATG